MAKRRITIGLSQHRPEMMPLIATSMQQHRAIFLEEPPDPCFGRMLEGRLAVEDYLAPLDVAYPDFSRSMCYCLKNLKAEGKEIIQVEPYLEILLGIHAYFTAGHGPADLASDSIQYPVYLAERNATRALMSFYKISMSGSFEDTLKDVKRFARMDAARFRLRDSLRAQAMASLFHTYPSVYVEAGIMHYPLWRLLRRQIDESTRLRLFFLTDEVKGLTGHRKHRYSPGDKLTLLYIFHPLYTESKWENLLAARSLIYSKITAKNELTADLASWPHLRDELNCIQITNRLSLDDCRSLYPLVRRSDTQQAQRIVEKYLSGCL
jgi:hypothetical protein